MTRHAREGFEQEPEPIEAPRGEQWLIYHIDIARLFDVDDELEWEGNLCTLADGVHRCEFDEDLLALLTPAAKAAVLGDRQGLLLKLPCARGALAEFIWREGLRYRINLAYLRCLSRAMRRLDVPALSSTPGALAPDRATRSRNMNDKKYAESRVAIAKIPDLWAAMEARGQSKNQAAILLAKELPLRPKTIREYLKDGRLKNKSSEVVQAPEQEARLSGGDQAASRCS